MNQVKNILFCLILSAMPLVFVVSCKENKKSSAKKSSNCTTNTATSYTASTPMTSPLNQITTGTYTSTSTNVYTSPTPTGSGFQAFLTDEESEPESLQLVAPNVQSFLQTNCFTCHGPGSQRGDFSNEQNLKNNNNALAYQIVQVVKRDDAATNPRRMPPSPALRIASEDMALLDGWQQQGFATWTYTNPYGYQSPSPYQRPCP